MKQTGILFVAIMALILSSACKKKKKEEQPEPKIPEYTITGTILNGTTNARFVNMPLEFDILYRKPFGSQNALHKILGKTLTNDTGGFVFTYLEQDVKGLNNPRIKLVSPQYNKNNIPVNQNVAEKLYQSSMGTLKIYLETDMPLQQGDTLFLAYLIKEGDKTTNRVDTITTPINGLFKTIQTAPPYINFYWGRGVADFKAAEQSHHGQWMQADVEGDPIINQATIKY